jgi:hypothetical protein
VQLNVREWKKVEGLEHSLVRLKKSINVYKACALDNTHFLAWVWDHFSSFGEPVVLLQLNVQNMEEVR